MKKRLILLGMCSLAAFSAALTQSGIYSENSGAGILQAPEATEIVMAIAMLSPAFGYLLVKRGK
jgi:hypothetical protein